MDTQEIFRLLARRCKGTFLGVFAKDTLPAILPPRRPLLLVCNTDPKSKPGEHWIAMYIGRNGRGEYFDSLGREPCSTFRRYLYKFCANVDINKQQIQSSISAFCGHYCVFYCLFKYLHYDMSSILNCFSKDTALNDAIVHKFVCHNF